MSEKPLTNLSDLEKNAKLLASVKQSTNFESYLAGRTSVIRYAQIRHEVNRKELRLLLDDVLGIEGRIINILKVLGNRLAGGMFWLELKIV